jgi:cbb3-type cytochrome oxidase subunit 3
MGKSLALATPFIVAFVMLLIWIAFRAGKRSGQNESPQRANIAQTKLLHRADDIFVDLLFVENIDTDDILTPRTRQVVNKWRNDYMDAKDKL